MSDVFGEPTMITGVIHPPQGFWIGVLGRCPVDGMIGPFATEAEAREALTEAVIVVTGLPAGWHMREKQ